MRSLGGFSDPDLSGWEMENGEWGMENGEWKMGYEFTLVLRVTSVFSVACHGLQSLEYF